MYEYTCSFTFLLQLEPHRIEAAWHELIQMPRTHSDGT